MKLAVFFNFLTTLLSSSFEHTITETTTFKLPGCGQLLYLQKSQSSFLFWFQKSPLLPSEEEKGETSEFSQASLSFIYVFYAFSQLFNAVCKPLIVSTNLFSHDNITKDLQWDFLGYGFTMVTRVGLM